MKDDVLNTGGDKHNYIVLGGHTSEWAQAALKRFTKINTFASNFELFWIKMPNSTPALELIRDLAENKGLKPKIDQTLEFTEENCRKVFDTLRGRRTAGKLVVSIID
jgi:NADPH:quinone reductase-like Zn-dependent oxidoreductase